MFPGLVAPLAASEQGVNLATVVVAVGAAVITGVIGYLSARTRNRHERMEALRQRQCAAADDFAKAVAATFPEVRAAAAGIASGGKPGLSRARNLVDDAHALEHRVEIMFGPASRTTAAARAVIQRLRVALAYLDATPATDFDHDEARRLTNDADTGLRVFAACAHGVIASRWWWQRRRDPDQVPEHDPDDDG